MNGKDEMLKFSKVPQDNLLGFSFSRCLNSKIEFLCLKQLFDLQHICEQIEYHVESHTFVFQNNNLSSSCEEELMFYNLN